MEKYFVLLGENPLLWGQFCHFRELGYKVILASWSEMPRIEGDMYIQNDIKDAKSIISEFETRGLNGLIYGALSSIDLAALTVNAINAWCDNDTRSEQFNEVLTKEEMRDAWMKEGVFNRISELDKDFPLDEIYDASQNMKLICKLNVAASSHGITLLEKGQTKWALEDTLTKAKEPLLMVAA